MSEVAVTIHVPESMIPYVQDEEKEQVFFPERHDAVFLYSKWQNLLWASC